MPFGPLHINPGDARCLQSNCPWCYGQISCAKLPPFGDKICQKNSYFFRLIYHLPPFGDKICQKNLIFFLTNLPFAPYIVNILWPSTPRVTGYVPVTRGTLGYRCNPIFEQQCVVLQSTRTTLRFFPL